MSRSTRPLCPHAIRAAVIEAAVVETAVVEVATGVDEVAVVVTTVDPAQSEARTDLPLLQGMPKPT